MAACLAAQLGLASGDWAETGPLRVRMGLHVGEGGGDGSDYHGPAVNRAARIMAAGHGGQVLLSGPTAALVMDQLPAGHRPCATSVSISSRTWPGPNALYQLDYPSMPSTFLPLTTADVRIGSLPEEPSPFVGRDAERAQVVERLRDRAIRLLTLTGPGGIGKTRLALRAARETQSRPSGRVPPSWTSRQHATRATVLTAIARELGFRDASEQAQLGELIGRLAPHAAAPHPRQRRAGDDGRAMTLLQLLASCPELTLLVTSREPLRVRGEHLFVGAAAGPAASVRSRPRPGSSSGSRPSCSSSSGRAAVKPDFRVTDDNAALVADICRRLEGLPLAIELAVARLRVFSLEALRERLGSRLRALGSGPRDLPERQQTLRATIDWSYQLLPPAEQRLFAIMACFSGADVEAVEAVVADLSDRPAGRRPVDGLVSLADKSLLRQVDRDDGTPRFEMLESVQEYAREQLEAEPDLARRCARCPRPLLRTLGRWARSAAPWSRTGRGARRARRTRSRTCGQPGAVPISERDLPLLEALLGGLARLYDARGWYRALAGLADEALGLVASLQPSPERDG